MLRGMSASGPGDDVFRGGGETGERLRAVDWRRHELGAPDAWPESLRTAVNLCLASRYPMFVLWGPASVYLYNDACSVLAGGKHPGALARPYPEVWPEIWESDIRPLLEPVLATGRASWADTRLLVLQRYGYDEECYFSFSFAPIRDEDGRVGGVFTAVSETTRQVLAERRLRTLSDLGARTTEAKSAREACELAGRVLADGGYDVPFALFYLAGRDGTYALAASTGLPAGHPAAPARIDLSSAHANDPWGMHPLLEGGGAAEVGDLARRFGPLPGGPWPEPTEKAMVLRIARAGQSRPDGFLVAGLSPRRALDRDYRAFLVLVANQLGAAVASALAYEETQKLNETALGLSAELDLQKLVQRVTDVGTELTAAKYGAFFYNTQDDRGESYVLFTLSGAPREAFEKFGLPRNTAMFGPTFRGEGVIRLPDVLLDSRYGRNAPHRGQPEGHLPVRSYLAVPVMSRAGGVIGGLFFGHPEPGVFTERSERLALGVAAQAAVAIDNAQLYRQATREIEERLRAEGELRASERLYRGIGESIEYGVWICDAAGRNLYASESFLRLVGRTQEECSSYGWADVLHPDDVAETITAWQESVRTGRHWNREHRYRGVDGKWHPILARGVPVRNERGEITAWVGINLDISELKQVEDELREGDRRKDEFLATLAHELRNPLAPIRNGLEVLRRSRNPEDVQQARDMMERQCEQMVRLLDDLLDVSRISRGTVQLRKERVDLAAVVLRAVETSRPLLQQAGHDLTMSMPPTPVFVDADVTRLAQVFANLLNNAAKYTERGGHVRLAVERRGDEVAVSVKDDGVGIPIDVLPLVFEMFVQVDHSLERTRGGLGIGLTIAKRLVEMHGGAIEALSAGTGTGSEFVVRLPAAPGGPASRGRGETAPAEGGAKRCILVVDDNVDSAQSLAMMLEIGGHTAHLAYDGVEAVEVAGAVRPQIILMDIGMPRLNGYDACRRIRAEEWGREIVMVALTGWGQTDDRLRSEEAGFDHHLVKPVEPAALDALLARL
jgi:PAS domain S-box-containing protein